MQSGKVSIAVQPWHHQLHKFSKKKVKGEDQSQCQEVLVVALSLVKEDRVENPAYRR